MRLRNKKNQGFTLVELMIVVAIVGILTSIALPYFSLQQTLAKRAEMVIGLSALWTSEQSYFSDNNAYTTQCEPAPQCNTCGGGWTTWANSISVAGASLQQAKFYRWCVEVPGIAPIIGNFAVKAQANLDRDPTIDFGGVTNLDRTIIIAVDDVAS